MSCHRKFEPQFAMLISFSAKPGSPQFVGRTVALWAARLVCSRDERCARSRAPARGRVALVLGWHPSRLRPPLSPL